MAGPIANPALGATSLAMKNWKRLVGDLTKAAVAEVIPGHRLSKEVIVIHEDEFVRQTRDSVDVQLNGLGVERWKVFMVFENL